MSEAPPAKKPLQTVAILKVPLALLGPHLFLSGIVFGESTISLHQGLLCLGASSVAPQNHRGGSLSP